MHGKSGQDGLGYDNRLCKLDSNGQLFLFSAGGRQPGGAFPNSSKRPLLTPAYSGARRRGRRGVGKLGPVGLGAQGRHRDCRADPRLTARPLPSTPVASRGSASTSDFCDEALRQTVEAAWHIARHTAADPAAGLPDADRLLTDYPDLGPALRLAHRHRGRRRAWPCAPSARVAVDPRITNTDGASVGTYEGQFVDGQHARASWVAIRTRATACRWRPSPGRGNNMQRDYWYSAERDPSLLASPEARAATPPSAPCRACFGRAASAPASFPCRSRPPLALGLCWARPPPRLPKWRGALPQGEASWPTRWASPSSPTISTWPKTRTCAAAWAARPSTTRACARRPARWSAGGVLEGLLPSTATARKLGTPTTGNAGGSHNLSMTSRLTRPDDDPESQAAQARHRAARHRADRL